ncbi:hypothetical protein EST38_g1798 [Candolleomyces aberdarensis]|uniref:2,5-diamino-6-ribosylamino-4(3H)-pyrimidinone 5'-phosphate reductase n=1 Tax=Candolleomyces aberdarensis TaxID=2316362 RepID=A0A4Q2DXM5_9AGAR|nr:hypothetical protein EST38_g1798 [Candolleomyces aberdarensis]
MDYHVELKTTDLTLTFAQSLDGKLAGALGSPVALSCRESMIMTHWLRSQHKGILIGINTAVNDNPQLNTRLLDGVHDNPQPIVLDTSLRFPLNAKLLANYAAGNGKQPWIISSTNLDRGWLDRKTGLEQAGARIIEVPDTRDIRNIVRHLSRLGIASLMVEGGAQIIRSFLRAHSTHPIIDNLIITVAPTFIGKDGVGYELDHDVVNLSFHRSFPLGRDTVMIFKPNV